MESARTQKVSFFKAHVLPVLFIFLIPGFSAWFFTYAEGWMDGIMRENLRASLNSNRTYAESKKAQLQAFYDAVPVSRIMASKNPEAAPMQAAFASVKTRYAIFTAPLRSPMVPA